MSITTPMSAALDPSLCPSAGHQISGTRHPRVLSIAGSDPSGGAGIQADIKSIAAHGGYAMAAITALTAQNTVGVHGIHVPPAGFLAAQLEALSADITIDAVKIGMLGSAQVMEAVGEWLGKTRPAVVVLDPVMVATSGDALMAPDAHAALLVLMSHAHLVTPNIPELAVLLGCGEAQDWEAAVAQGRELAAGHGLMVLVKGGHLPGERCLDALVHRDGSVQEFSAPRIHTPNTHGTGCSLSSAVATLQAQRRDWGAAVQESKAWLTQALENSDVLAVGAGAGPINHLHALWESSAPAGNAFSNSVWRECEPQREAIFALDFIKELAAGTLAGSRFAYYLAQDALYLGSYSRVLARASALAPTDAQQKFWANGAQNCLDVELALHRDWLSNHPGGSLAQGPVTKHYVDHLAGVALWGSYGEIVAALLPCYWLYAEVGRVLHADYLNHAGEHPYANWLATYADEDFAQAAATAVGIMDSAARQGSPRERARMRDAFAHSAQYEVDFFAAPHRHVPLIGD